MKQPELPDKLDELMAGYVLGNLSPEEAEELQQLLNNNPAKLKELHSLQEVLDLMPYALPSIPLPQNLRASIFEAANLDMELKHTKNRFSLTWGKTLATVATLLALTLGWHNYNLRQNLSIAQSEVARQKDVIAMLQNPDTHLVSLKGMDMAPTANGRIIMTPGEPQSVLIVQNLPVLPKGKYYQLWSIVQGEKIPSGKFNANENGTVLVKLSTPSALDVTGLLITIEESSSPTNQPGPLVMTSGL